MVSFLFVARFFDFLKLPGTVSTDPFRNSRLWFAGMALGTPNPGNGHTWLKTDRHNNGEGRIVLASTGRLGWFLIGVILGAIVLEVYNGIVGFVPRWLGSAAAVVGFLIDLVAWFGLMLAVASVLGSRIIRKDQMNYSLIGFGAIIMTLELWLSVPFR